MIPKRVLEQHIAILGKTGSGKSYCAKGIVETLLNAGERVCVLDPTSGWWGLRSDATGKKAGFPITIFGGEHADLPLNQNHGAAIAEIIATTSTSAVLDTRLMTVGERTRCFTDFAEMLLRKNKGTLHVVIDEAHLFAPQGRVNDPQSGKMLHAANNLVSLGRGIGLRIMLISQRPAKLHKDSLTQIETLIAMRLIAPQDRSAVEDWIGEWADPKQGKDLLQSLPSLPTGEGWLWSPESNILQRMKFPRISTYDSSRAPDGASGKIVLANIDLPTIQKRLETVAHDALASDPKYLRSKIFELQAQINLHDSAKAVIAATPVELKNARTAGAEAVKKTLAREIRIYEAKAATLFKHSKKMLEAALHSIQEGLRAFDPDSQLLPTLPSLEDLIVVQPPEEKRDKWIAENEPWSKDFLPKQKVPINRAPINPEAANELSGPARKILSALMRLEAVRLAKAPKTLIALMVGYSNTASTGFAKGVSNLSARGLISYPGSGEMQLTHEGRSIMPAPEVPMTTAELHRTTLEIVGGNKAEMLRLLLEAYPKSVSRERLMEEMGYSNAASTGFVKALSTLSGFGLIEYPERGQVQAKGFLFL